jgi:FkbM family methyltransferase
MTTAAAPVRTQDGPRLATDLVFDVGFHEGEDTRYYLRKGLRVVAFEAHPGLLEAAERRFAAEIADGRLVLVGGAITDGPAEYTHSLMSFWGTTESDRAERNEVLGQSIPVTVPAVRFGECLREHGVPHVLKIDIEASDMLCLEPLRDVPPEERPRYVSIEAETDRWAGFVEQLDALCDLGYARFALVQQGDIGGSVGPIRTRDGRTIPYRFDMNSCGPFGEDLREPWVDRRAVLRRYRRILPALQLANAVDRIPLALPARHVAAQLAGRPLPGWYDLHAAR